MASRDDCDAANEAARKRQAAQDLATAQRLTREKAARDLAAEVRKLSVERAMRKSIPRSR